MALMEAAKASMVAGLLAEGCEQLSLPHPRVEVPGLAVARPVPVRIGQGEIELVQDPCGEMVRGSQENRELIAGRPTLEIV